MPEKGIRSFYQCLLQLFVLAVLLRSSQQQGTSRSWDRVSRLVPNSLYERRNDVVSSSSGNKQVAHVSSLHLLEENNVMEASKIGLVEEKHEEDGEGEEELENSPHEEKEEEQGEEEYNDEYEIESYHAGEKDSPESSLNTQDDTRNQIPTNSTKKSLPEDEHSREHEDYLSEEGEEEEGEEQQQQQHEQEEEEEEGEEPEIHDDSDIYYADNENNSSLYEALDSSEVVPEDKDTNLKKNSSNEAVETEEASLKKILSSEYSVDDEEDKDSEASEIEEINTDGNSSREDGNENHSTVDESSKDNQNDSIWIGEAVVSVVTTKSVVNGTISIPETTPSSLTTEPVLLSPSSSLATTIPPPIHTTDDSSIILASVQTSRSVSGARFLPFPVIDRVEELNPNSSTASPSAKDTSLLSESTESIIDKLDERQSELSSGILVNGFRASGNTLQLDLPDRDRTTTRRRYGTTAKTPSINKFAPRRYNDKKLEYTPTAVSTPVPTATYIAAVKPESASTEHSVEDMFQDVPINSVATTSERTAIPLRWPSRLASLPKSSGIKTTIRATTTTTTTTTSTPIILSKIENVKIQDVSAFLPPGYQLKKEESEVKESPTILSDILAKSKVDISSFLPPDFNKKNSEAKEIVPTAKSTEPSVSKEIVPKSSLSDLFAKSSVDISSLLPSDYKQKKINVTTGIVDHSKTVDGKVSTASPIVIESTSAAVPVTTKKPDGLKVVFPSRPGGRKPIYKITTPQSARGEGVGHVTPRIQKGWPTRATTEFTGWPTSSTTPISIEKLLEAARTATIASMNASLTPTTSLQSSTSTTSTTTTTQRSTTPGVCEEECEVAGTIRIVGNAAWVPELLDRNTHEWQDLANEIEKEMNIVFSKSTVLKNWYKKIRIDSFSQGSILVDYFVELNNLVKKINTQELKAIFHESLKTHNSKQYNDTQNKDTIKFGKFTIDPKSTDFVVIPKVSIPQYVERDDRFIPQWAIAVIVIGVGGLLFIIVFGVSVLINRQNEAKLKPSISAIYEGEVAKNMIHANHPSSSHRSTDYPKQISSIWNDPDVSWNDRSFESTSNKILVDRTFPDERKYNLYDSWRSEWNGYYYNASHPSNKYAGYDNATNLSSRHHSDYDTNF